MAMAFSFASRTDLISCSFFPSLCSAHLFNVFKIKRSWKHQTSRKKNKRQNLEEPTTQNAYKTPYFFFCFQWWKFQTKCFPLNLLVRHWNHLDKDFYVKTIKPGSPLSKVSLIGTQTSIPLWPFQGLFSFWTCLHKLPNRDGKRMDLWDFQNKVGNVRVFPTGQDDKK